MSSIILNVVAAASGVAIILLALVVVFTIDPRRRGRLAGLGWLAAGLAAFTLVLQAVAPNLPPPAWNTVVLAGAFAVLGWRYRALLLSELGGPASARDEGEV